MAFEELMDIIYMLKLLCEVDRELFFHISDLDGVCVSSDDGCYYDGLYEMAMEISDNLFAFAAYEYYERHGFSITVFSDPLMEEYFRLAGEYGGTNGLSEGENPYFEMADDEMRRNFKEVRIKSGAQSSEINFR